MGLGDFADSSTGSGTSSKSRSPEDDAKEGDENPPQVTMDEDKEVNRKSSTLVEKMDKGLDELSPSHISSTSSERQSSLTTGTKKSEGPGRSGEAAFDDAVDGMEDNEDWDFSLPVDSTDSHPMSGKGPKSAVEGNSARRKSLRHRNRRDEEEDEEMTQEREGSTESSTSHSSQELTPDSRQGLNICHLHVNSSAV